MKYETIIELTNRDMRTMDDDLLDSLYEDVNGIDTVSAWLIQEENETMKRDLEELLKYQPIDQ